MQKVAKPNKDLNLTQGIVTQFAQKTGKLRANCPSQVKSMFYGRATRAQLHISYARAIHGAEIFELEYKKAKGIQIKR